MEFTIEERDKVNEIYAKNCENLTADEVRLLVSWESSFAAHSAKVSEEIEQLKRETDARIEHEAAIANNAIDSLNAMVNAALARMEAIDNG